MAHDTGYWDIHWMLRGTRMGRIVASAEQYVAQTNKGADGALVWCLIWRVSDCRRGGHQVSDHADRRASGRAGHLDAGLGQDHWGGCHVGVRHTD